MEDKKEKEKLIIWLEFQDNLFFFLNFDENEDG